MFDFNKLSQYSKPLVRISISLVFLWFGINQLIMPEEFMGYLPDFILNTDYAQLAVTLNGLFEVIFGTLLIIGFFVRPVSLLLALHLFSITLTLGYNDIAIRDFGLTLVTIAVFLGGADKWTIDYKKQNT